MNTPDPDFDQPPDERQFDQWLRQARWPQTDGPAYDAARQRLLAQWRTIAPRPSPAEPPRMRRHPRAAAAVALVASLLAVLVASAALVALRGERPVADRSGELPPPAEQPAEESPGRWEQEDDLSEDGAAVPTPPESPSRKPNEPDAPQTALRAAPHFEQLVGHATQRLRRQEPLERRVASVIAQLAAGEPPDPQTLAELHRAGHPARHAILAVARAGSPTQQTAAVDLFAHLGTPLDALMLAELSTDRQMIPLAGRTLARMADSLTLAQLATHARYADLRPLVFRTLLERGDPLSVALYLEFIDRGETGALALAAARQIESPPLDTLLGLLDSHQQSHRLAAARVLGQLDDPRAVGRLVEIATRRPGRYEAMVGLLSSGSPAAEQAVARARLDPRLAPSLVSAWNHLDPNVLPANPWRTRP